MNQLDYLKLLGRDGSYVEFDVAKMPELVANSGDQATFPKMLVLKCGRLELSDPAHVEAFRLALAKLAKDPSVQDMNQEQLGFYVFRQIFEEGLKSIAR
jgi:hypothetical protein